MAPYRFNAPLSRKVRSPASKRSPLASNSHLLRAKYSTRKAAGTPDYPYSRRDNYITVSECGRPRERTAAKPVSPDHRQLRFTRDSFLLDEPEDDPDEDEPERLLFRWEDEKTLVSDMMHDGTPEDSEREQLSSLAESIQVVFSCSSKALIDDIADTLVPAVNRVKLAHQVLNTEMDSYTKRGIQDFDEGCRKMETVTLADTDNISDAYCQAQERIKNLFKQLREAYVRRDQLWVDFDLALNETINPTIEALKNLPADMECTINDYEKQSKQVVQKDIGSTEKVLKGLLSKFV
ncbi:hypothetical protein Moror_10776 [Moniliophthora roreri MCA 2997]|uniref:Uncharacterized protein n=2 Tax=Moniliophthora roreri TaxID=221103 RepID=V2X6D3_MONRO|nr:hypothetical protein Moror_10776 [Moniliophthora roreri MCA 2997]KAI3616639.1 hypothetical protein WG66_011539 [Moniliophthora roreri]